MTLRLEGRTVGMLAENMEALRGVAVPAGVRLLPASDPLVQARDREVLVPDRERRRVVWRPVGSPGVVVVDGDIAGTWRARVAGRRLRVTVAAFDGLSGRVRAGVEGEASLVARARGVRDVEVSYESW